MNSIQRKPLPVHEVVVDTNILWDKDKKHPVCIDFDTFWVKNSALIKMELHVPEVVIGELQFQQTTSALKALKLIKENLNELSGVTCSVYTHKANEATIKKQVGVKLDKWLKNHSGKILQTPVAKIDWDSMVDAAIWRKSPFTYDPKEKNNEKGFRDALILETLVQSCKDVGPAKMVVFLCNDHMLRTTAEERLKKNNRLLAFESTADYEAYIHLTQQKFDNEFVKSIQSRARSKFHKKGDANSIVLQFNILERIRKDFATELAAPSELPPTDIPDWDFTPIQWEIVKQRPWVRTTKFSHLVGKREFHWVSTVEIVQLFEWKPADEKLRLESRPLQKISAHSFEVSWMANVKADGRFHNLDVTSIKKIDVNMLDASEDEMVRLQLTA